MIEYDYVKTRRDAVRPIKRPQIPVMRFLMCWAARVQIAVFRASKGRLMNTFLDGFPICVVTTKGAKSGKFRRIALIHLPLGNGKLLVSHRAE